MFQICLNQVTVLLARAPRTESTPTIACSVSPHGQLLANQTWVRLSVCSETNLLTLGSGEEKCSLYCKGADTRRTGGSCSKTLNSVSASIFKSQVREGGHRVCDQLMHNLIGWWWGNRAGTQWLTLSILGLQEAWGLGGAVRCSWSSGS